MNEQKINEAVEVLRNGGVVIYPTDTLYGLGADVTNPQAIAKVYRIKGRQISKELSWTFADLEMVKQYAQVSPQNETTLKKYLPGKYTFILPAKKGKKTIGVRVPDRPIARELSKLLGKPITATSANKAGEEPINTLHGLENLGADYVLWTNPPPQVQPSTLVDLTDNRPQVLRQGPSKFPR